MDIDRRYKLVIYNTGAPDDHVVIESFNNKSQATAALKNFARAKWDLERRPGLGIIDYIVIKVIDAEGSAR